MTVFQIAMSTLMLVLSVSLGACVWRLLLGPSIPDRAAAFDMVMIHLVALIALFVVITGRLILLDAVIVVAVVGFLGTVALARFIEEGRN